MMKNNGKSDYTIKFTDKALTYISKHADLNNPEAVKHFIANKNVSNGYKKNLCLAYDHYCKYYDIEWNMPTYLPQAKQIRIPSTENLQMLIAYAGKTLGTKLRLSKETGLRPIELLSLRAKDIDLEKGIIYPTTAKHGSGRALNITKGLVKSLADHITRHDLNPNERVFNGTAEDYGKHYRVLRNRLAKKLNNPTLRTIRLYDFRHYFATMLYHKTRDILFVKQQMGHRKIETTLAYTQLLTVKDDEWVCKATANNDEATQLIENGFEYVLTTPDGLMMFRKRK